MSSPRPVEHNYITEAGLKRLDEYKYISGGYSWLDNKMNPFWLFVVDHLTPSVNLYPYFLKLPLINPVACSQPNDDHRFLLYVPVLYHHALL